MKKRNYGCGICNHSFSRKANAERHNERIHDDLATINDMRIKHVSNIELTSKNPFYKNKFKQFQSHSTKVKNDISDNLFSEYINFESKDDNLKVMKIFGQLKQPFEELEILIDEPDENLRANILCRFVISSLNSYRPVKSMKDIVEIYKSIKCMNKIACYFLKSDKISPEEAKSKLISLVQNSDYFKNNIN